MNAARRLTLTELTPAGRGAISVVRLEGPGAAERVDSHFTAADRRPLAGRDADRPIVGRFGPEPAEQVVVLLVPPQHAAAGDSAETPAFGTPMDFTLPPGGSRGTSGEGNPCDESGLPRPSPAAVRAEPPGGRVKHVDGIAVEICCHGGRAAVARIVDTLSGGDVERLPWPDWIERHESDPIRAAAMIDLAEAPTLRTATILLDQYHGALRRAMDAIPRAAEPRPLVDTLLARAELGRHLIRPWRIVVAGRPNVGKSSLINAILGYQRAIVHPTAGTTRDAVRCPAAIDGWPVELCDTAGLSSVTPEHRRDASGTLEHCDTLEHCGTRERRDSQAVTLAAEMVRRATDAIAAADLTLLVLDRSQPLTDDDRHLLAAYPDAMIVLNKSDLPPADGHPDGLRTSALTGDGIDALLAAIAHRVVPDPPPSGAAVPFRPEHIAWLRARLGPTDK